MLIHEKRYEKFERTHIYGTRATHENTLVWREVSLATLSISALPKACLTDTPPKRIKQERGEGVSSLRNG